MLVIHYKCHPQLLQTVIGFPETGGECQFSPAEGLAPNY